MNFIDFISRMNRRRIRSYECSDRMRRNWRTSFPGIAVAEVLRDRGHEVMLLVSEKDIDALALSGRGISSGKIAHRGTAIAIFSGVFWFPSPFLRKSGALPIHL